MTVEKIDALVSGVSHNHEYKILENSLGHFCGYVKTNLSSEWSYKELREPVENRLIDVHGGLTYGVDKHGWVGFDCGNKKDVCITDEEMKKEYDLNKSNIWTVEDVREECEILALQVNALENFAEKFSSRGYDKNVKTVELTDKEIRRLVNYVEPTLRADENYDDATKIMHRAIEKLKIKLNKGEI